MPIAFLLEEFCNYSQLIKGHSMETIKRYKENISYFCRYSGINHINQIDRNNTLSFFLYGRKERNWRARTYRTYYMSLRVFFRWCKERGYIDSNFVEDIELPKLEESKKRGLTRQEAQRLLEFVYNCPYEQEFQRFRNHAIFATFIFAGLRRSELVNLKYKDVDVVNRTLFVRDGKGGKDRMVPINNTLALSLDRYFHSRIKEGKTCPEFFASSKRNTGLTSHGLKHLIDNTKCKSGIQFGSHILRHTFATLMLQGGCDIYSLSRMMGHSRIDTTTIYLSATVEHLRSEMSKHPLSTTCVDPF